MTNPFDLSGHESQDMGGLFSKLKKAVKKVGRGIEKVAKKVTPKPIKEAARKVQKEVLRSPIARAGVLIAGSLLMGPVVSTIVGKTGAVTSPALLKGATAVGRKALTSAVQKGVAKKATSQAKAALQKQVDSVASINAQMARDPDFRRVVMSMKAAGKGDADIVKTWSQSKTATTAAQKQVAKTLLPQITAKLKADKSVPSKDVPILSNQIANMMASNAVKTAQTKIVAPVIAQAKATPKPVVVNTAKVHPATVKTVTGNAPVVAQSTLTPIPVLPLLAIGASLLM